MTVDDILEMIERERRMLLSVRGTDPGLTDFGRGCLTGQKTILDKLELKIKATLEGE